ncbi:hypothetical protein HDU98_001110 [Podochytrium sp. JEL0797]|nr:hypothetical protein HDU98_001110 [Podochytrium sp. JEL0797]
MIRQTSLTTTPAKNTWLPPRTPLASLRGTTNAITTTPTKSSKAVDHSIIKNQNTPKFKLSDDDPFGFAKAASDAEKIKQARMRSIPQQQQLDPRPEIQPNHTTIPSIPSTPSKLNASSPSASTDSSPSAPGQHLPYAPYADYMKLKAERTACPSAAVAAKKRKEREDKEARFDKDEFERGGVASRVSKDGKKKRATRGIKRVKKDRPAAVVENNQLDHELPMLEDSSIVTARVSSSKVARVASKSTKLTEPKESSAPSPVVGTRKSSRRPGLSTKKAFVVYNDDSDDSEQES